MSKIITLLVAIGISAYSWEGYDYENSSYVEIERGNLVRTGKDIELYDYSTGDYKSYEVESIQRSGSTVEIELYDYEKGTYRTVEMTD